MITYYQADTANPWSYCWIGFNGISAELLLNQAGLTKASPIFHYDRDDMVYQYLQLMNESRGFHKARETRLTGLLYLLLSLLVEFGPVTSPELKETRTEIYVEKVKGSSPKHFRAEIQAQLQNDSQKSIQQIEEEHLFYSGFLP